MLLHSDAVAIRTALALTGDEKCNLADHDLLTHARNVIAITRSCHEQLEVIKQTLKERQGYVDGVMWQIAELSVTPTLVLAE